MASLMTDYFILLSHIHKRRTQRAPVEVVWQPGVDFPFEEIKITSLPVSQQIQEQFSRCTFRIPTLKGWLNRYG